MKPLKLTTSQSNKIDWNKSQYLIEKDTDPESPTIVLFRADWYQNDIYFSGILFPCKEYPLGGAGMRGRAVGEKANYLPFTGKATLEISND